MFGTVKKAYFKKEAWVEIYVFLGVFDKAGEKLKKQGFDQIIEQGFKDNLAPTEVAAICATHYVTGLIMQLPVHVRKTILQQFKQCGLEFFKHALLGKIKKYPEGFLPGTLMVGSVIAVADTYNNQDKYRSAFYDHVVSNVYAALTSDNPPSDGRHPLISNMF